MKDHPAEYKTPGGEAQGSSTNSPQKEVAEPLFTIARNVPSGKVLCFGYDPPTDASQARAWHFITPKGVPLTVLWEIGRYEVGKVYDETEL
jgi:hypothetical protein